MSKETIEYEEYRRNWLAKFPEEVARFAKMPLDELRVIFDGLNNAAEATLGIINQPRAAGPGGQFVEELNERIADIRQVLVCHVEGREIRDKNDHDAYANIIMGYQLMCEPDPNLIMTIACEIRARYPAH